MTFCETPNQHARRAAIEVYEHAVVFHGYQEFLLTREAIRVADIDENLRQKWLLLQEYFTPRFLKHRSILDLGANSGFLCFWAIQNGATHATAIDVDAQYTDIVSQAIRHLGFDAVRTMQANAEDWQEPADIVCAIALIHWIYSCTAQFGSIDAIIARLAHLTNYMLLVEWVDPEDAAINFFRHTEWNKDIIREPYTFAHFEQAMGRHFARVAFIGNVSATRRLYIGYVSPQELDLSGPLPLLALPATLLSSRLLGTSNGIAYWSQVYDGGEVIYKQCTLDLALREAEFLRQLGSSYFPQVIEARTIGNYSIVTLEKVTGPLVSDWVADQKPTLSQLAYFFRHCLALVAELQEQRITHRDIKASNILVRNGRPVLVDFGWAIADKQPYVTPPGLGDEGRPPDGSFSDIYAMGKVFQQLIQPIHSAMDGVVALMTAPDAALRLTDLKTLDLLLAIACEESTSATSEDHLD